MDGAAKEEELLGKSCFAGVGVGNDGKSASACYFFFESHLI